MLLGALVLPSLLRGQCNTGYSLSPSSGTYPATSGVSSFQVTIPQGCFYYAIPQNCFSWLGDVVSGPTGTVTFFRSLNTGCSSRSCYIAVMNQFDQQVATFNITQAGAGSMAQPGAITGPTLICEPEEVTYSIPNLSGATGYEWSYTGLGQLIGSGTSITFTPTTSGTLSVVGTNSCGSSTARTLSVVIGNTITAPSMIDNSSQVCAGAPHIFSVPAVVGATNYTWSYAGEVVGTGPSTMVTFVPPGDGTLSVTAGNGCVESEPLEVEIITTTVPASPTAVVGEETVCINETTTYTVDEVPNTVSYLWELPSGWTGSSASNSIEVQVGTTPGTIRVAALNSCGASAYAFVAVTFPEPTLTLSPIEGPSVVCTDAGATYSVEASSAAAAYEWILPATWSGSTTTTSITVEDISAGGTISVSAFDGCVNTPVQSLDVVVSATVDITSTISGAQEPCTGALQTYAVVADPLVDSYEWTLPNGWSGTSTTTTIVVTPGILPGAIRVSGVNQCGAGEQVSCNLSVRLLPITPSFLAGEDIVCIGEAEVYTTQNIPSLDYLWEITGATVPSISTGGNNVVVTWAQAGDQTISVSGVNLCGTGEPRVLDVVVEDCVYIDELVTNGTIKLFPNPAVESITLEWNAELVTRRVDVLDASGRQVLSVLPNDRERVHMDTSMLGTGLYQVVLVTDHGARAVPFVKN